MNKSYNNETVRQSTVSEEDMKLINAYSQKELKSDEIFTFSVILCDNEIDRDYERFTADSLKTLAELFVGKTAIKNHSCNSDDQSARTYKTEVVTDEGRKNSLGEPYTYLKAYCYMPRLKKNEDFIREIETGIKKEVSIGCSVKRGVCSICGSDRTEGPCHHKKGRKYKGKLCYVELCEPYDAYEWSFVAVPAQRNAGVTKSFKDLKEKDMTEIVKALKSCGEELVLSAAEAHELSDYIDGLSAKALDGEEYRRQLECDIVKLFALSIPNLTGVDSRKICDSLTTAELKQLRTALRENKKQVDAPQLFSAENKGAVNNSQFRF